MTFEDTMAALVDRIATRCGVHRARVSVGYAWASAEDGGPGWTLAVLVPREDKRRVDERVVATGATLTEAEAALVESLARRERPAALPPDIQAALEAALAERERKR